MTIKVDGERILHLLARNEREIAKVCRHIQNDAAMGGSYFEQMAKDGDRHHDAFLQLAERAKSDGGWVIDGDEYEFFRLRFERSLLADPDDLLKMATGIGDHLEMYEFVERMKREAVEIVRELQDIIPRFAPKVLKSIEQDDKNHLKKVTERILDHFRAKESV